MLLYCATSSSTGQCPLQHFEQACKYCSYTMGLVGWLERSLQAVAVCDACTRGSQALQVLQLGHGTSAAARICVVTRGSSTVLISADCS